MEVLFKCYIGSWGKCSIIFVSRIFIKRINLCSYFTLSGLMLIMKLQKPWQKHRNQFGWCCTVGNLTEFFF